MREGFPESTETHCLNAIHYDDTICFKEMGGMEEKMVELMYPRGSHFQYLYRTSGVSPLLLMSSAILNIYFRCINLVMSTEAKPSVQAFGRKVC